MSAKRAAKAVKPRPKPRRSARCDELRAIARDLDISAPWAKAGKSPPKPRKPARERDLEQAARILRRTVRQEYVARLAVEAQCRDYERERQAGAELEAEYGRLLAMIPAPDAAAARAWVCEARSGWSVLLQRAADAEARLRVLDAEVAERAIQRPGPLARAWRCLKSVVTRKSSCGGGKCQCP